MSSKIFEEAIADAKKLKDVAEDNAKKAILEAVTPKIREFIENTLLEDDKDASDEGTLVGNPSRPDEEANLDNDVEEQEKYSELDEDVVLNEESLMSLINMLGGKESLGIENISENKDNPYKNTIISSVRKTVSSLTDNEREKLLHLSNKIAESADKLENTVINNNVIKNQENNNMKNNDKFYEVDLRALRESVEREMEEMSDEVFPMDIVGEEDETLGAYESMSDSELMNEISLLLDLGDDIEEDQLPEELRGMLVDDEEGEEDVDLEGEEGEEADDEGEFDFGEFGDEEEAELPEEPEEEAKLDEVFEVDPRILRQEIRRIKRQIRESVGDSWGGKGNANAGSKNSYGGKGPKKLGVKKSFGGGSEGQDAFTNPPQINKLNEAVRQLRRQNRSQKEKLNKYRSAVKTLREQLEDLNLFNAKLLYVNKLLQNKGLNESQKKSIIKALDEARTLGETKALFRSLTESLSTSRKNLNESNRRGSSSRTTTSSSSKRTEAASEMSRWQKLAGLK